MIDGFNSEWKHITSERPQGSFLGPELFIIYFNEVDVIVNNCFSTVADYTNIGISVLTEKGRQNKTSKRICTEFQLGPMDLKYPLMLKSVRSVMLEQEIRRSIRK